MSRLRRILLTLRRRAGDNRKGIAATEFALIAPIMITVLLAVVDIGNALQQNIRLEAAARSALGYAHVYSSDTNGIGNIVRNALSGWNNVTVNVPAMVCTCANTATNTEAVGTCSADCTTGLEQRRFLSVTVTMSYSGIMFMQNRNLTGNVQMRIQ
ncbi:MAG TPA: TadE/TadG family type IV pilus assembly protein [Acetobacteraceae bacterium]|nr:TadE/TadG family type IV pilus assembly protein [Acetobacteraceae bacterium]